MAGALDHSSKPIPFQCEPEWDDSHFDIIGIELPKVVLDILALTLKICHFKSLFFSNTNFGCLGILFVKEIIENNPNLESLSL